MKKIYITIFTLVILMISMTASVFAWFVNPEKSVNIDRIGGMVISPSAVDLSDTAIDFKFESPEYEYLIYINDSDLSDESTTELSDYATTITITLTNKTTDSYAVTVFPELMQAEVAYLSGVKEALKYISYKDGTTYTRSDVKNGTEKSVLLEPGVPTVIHVDFWAYYDGLGQHKTKIPGHQDPIYLKQIYYALIYYISINIK